MNSIEKDYNPDSKIVIPDKENLIKKLKAMLEGGIERFKIIADYDQTITAKHKKGELAHDTFDVFTHSDKISED